MADIFSAVCSVVQCLSPCFNSSAAHSGYISKPDDNLNELKTALKGLEAKRKEVERKVDDGELKGERRLEEVERWLSEVQTILNNANKLVADASAVQQRRSSSRCCSNNVTSTYRCGKKISKMLSEVKNLYSEKFPEVVTRQATLPVIVEEPAQQTFGLVENEDNLEDLEMEVETLKAMINKLLRRVSKEKDKGLQTLPEVEKWISMAEEIESKASSLLYESISLKSPATLHYSETVFMTLKEVKALRSEGVFKELVERAPLSHVKKMHPLQPIVSREMLLEKVWKCLAENKCRSLGLYGMAGVGKTTLLTQIQKKFVEDGDASSLVIFAVVESEEVVESIQDEIGKRLGLDMRRKDKKEKAFEILEILNVKRFVLLLDGIQRKLDLEEIGVPLPSRENGCKIIFTTRSREACGSKWVDAVEEVKCLSQEEAWDIFKEIVGETTLNSHPDIPQLARIVARKCGGLPIALSLIGETMSRKRTVREWHQAIHVLVSSSAAEFSGMEAELLPILKFTYDNLPGENIRSCFLYCALFPKDEDTSKQDLVDCWIGEGIIEEEDREMSEIQGYEMISDLVRMRLLMDNKSGYGVKMHGMVREMALWIASDFGRQKENFVVVSGQRLHQMPEVNDWRIVRRMSVTCTQIENISDSPDCSDLTTLFLQGNSNLKWISGDFFRWMTSLVVLNLSSNREFSELPEEVSSLVSLQFLNLSFTSIKRLPFGLKELKRLIHLDLDYTTLLQEIDVIGSLLNLKVLRLFQSVHVDLSLMEDIQLLKSLEELSLTVREADVLKRFLSIHQLTRCIRRLHLTGIKMTDGGILLFNSLLSLRELNIGMCDIPEITISWRSTIQREKIPLLQNIHTVTLSRCPGLRDVTWLLFAPNLGDLRIHECQKIERIINREKAPADMSEQPFQNLTRLSLDSLPQLESIYWTPLPFPVLEYLYIRGCPKLRRLPFNSHSAKGNQMRSDLDKEWIKGVEWEDEATKQHFSGFDDRDFQKMPEDQKMDDFASLSHQIENIVTGETSESGKRTTTNIITDFDDRDFQKMAEDQKMDDFASLSHQIENIVTGETSESGKRTTTNIITDFDDRDFKKMAEELFQSKTHATMQLTQTDDHKMIDTPGTIMSGELLSFGIQKLCDLLSHEHEQFQGVKDQFTELKIDIRFLSSFLKGAHYEKHASVMVRNCLEDIQEIILDAEDIIETFMLKNEHRKNGGVNKLIRRLAFIRESREVALEIGSLRKRISKVIHDMEIFGVQQIIFGAADSQPPEERLEFSMGYESNFVGMERNVTKLVGYLVEKDDVQVVSISGMGGLGKTTLARQAFNHKMVTKKFDRHAWVCVSQICNRKNVWQTILQNFRPKAEENDILQMTEATLEGELFRLLETSNSLIVFDDIWTKEDWNLIKPIFPHQKGWKVLLTSRNDNVAGCGEMYINFKPDFLSFQDSWTLFQRIAMPSKDPSELKNVDKEMEEMGKKMITYCGGLPLAIKGLGGLLAAKYTLPDWRRVYDNIGSHVLGITNDYNNTAISHVLFQTYEELPTYLKYCFLYLAHFPEDYEINVEALAYYWAAEGILRYNDGETLRDVGDRYIEELVRRNMVISERDNTTSRFETCHLHDSMRDICLLKAKEENFLQIIGISSPTAHSQSLITARRFVSHHPTTLDVEREINNSKVRSLMVVWNISWSNHWKPSRFCFTRLQLLRVLHIPGVEFKGGELPSNIGELIHLRYLNLEDARVSHLPSSLQNLKLLIYLDLNLNGDSIHMHNFLMGMKELRYLALPKHMHKKKRLELSHLVNLETLENISTENCSLDDLHGMVRLRTLGVFITGESSLETLSASIGGLRHLESLDINYKGAKRMKEWRSLFESSNLKQMKLSIDIPLSSDELQFHSSLISLSLKDCYLEEDPLPILEKLGQLKEVHLDWNSFLGRKIVCSGSGFPQLKKLELKGLEEWEEWTVEEGSMPFLHTLTIGSCKKLKELPDGLLFIPSLKNLNCHDMGEEWKERLSKGGEDYYKVQNIPFVKFYGNCAK